jgi:hypothetical protein
MRGVNSPLFTEGALIRDPRAVPNLCKADSGLSAMFWYLGSNIVTSSGSLQDTFLYLLVSNSAPIVRAQDKGARILALPPSLGCFGAGARGPGSLGLAPVVATASFPLINLPKFYLSFTILVSLILVKYPDRVGLVNTVP